MFFRLVLPRNLLHMLNKTITTLFIGLLFFGFKSDKKAYQVFDQNGKGIAYDKMVKKIAEADIILFGELYDNPINHWMKYEITIDIFENYNDYLALGAQRYESDNQLIINEYLGGHIDYKTLKRRTEVWEKNFSDFHPLLDFARDHQLTFVASNIPRRYAGMVSEQGFKAFNHLSLQAQKYIAPLPLTYNDKLKCYTDIKKMKSHGKITGENLAKAQASKDATMAHFILKNMIKERTFIHFNGAYHSKNYEGIYWYLKQANPELKIATINCVEQESIDDLSKEHLSSAHYIIATPLSIKKAN